MHIPSRSRRRPATLAALACAVPLLVPPAVSAGEERAAGRAACSVTVPTRVARSGPVPTAVGFNYGGSRLRVHLGWPRGTLPAGILPDGGSYATVAEDGSIYLKLGWWRGVPGRLRITGRRLDAPAPPLRAAAGPGYGPRGFQPSGLVFPTVGCWRVVGQVGTARLAFVVLVTKLPWH